MLFSVVEHSKIHRTIKETIVHDTFLKFIPEAERSWKVEIYLFRVLENEERRVEAYHFISAKCQHKTELGKGHLN